MFNNNNNNSRGLSWRLTRAKVVLGLWFGKAKTQLRSRQQRLRPLVAVVGTYRDGMVMQAMEEMATVIIITGSGAMMITMYMASDNTEGRHLRVAAMI